jgi:hypothetical protein
VHHDEEVRPHLMRSDLGDFITIASLEILEHLLKFFSIQGIGIIEDRIKMYWRTVGHGESTLTQSTHRYVTSRKGDFTLGDWIVHVVTNKIHGAHLPLDFFTP